MGVWKSKIVGSIQGCIYTKWTGKHRRLHTRLIHGVSKIVYKVDMGIIYIQVYTKVIKLPYIIHIYTGFICILFAALSFIQFLL